MRAGDVRRRRQHVIGLARGRAPRLDAAIPVICDRRIGPPGGRVDRVRLLRDRGQAGIAIGRRVAEDRLVTERVVARLEEQLVADRHRPRALVHVEGHVEIAAPSGLRGFRRHLRRVLVVAETDPVRAAIVAALRIDLQRRTFAAVLVLGVEADAVLAELPRHAPDDHRAVLYEPRLDRRAHPVPARRVAGIGIRGNALHPDLRAEIPVAAEEPEPIPHDRTTERSAPVVGLDHARGLTEVRVERADLVGQVVAARPVTGSVVERSAREDVAAGARDDVHDRPADVALAEAATHVDGDFVGVHRVIDIRGEAAAARRRQRESR